MNLNVVVHPYVMYALVMYAPRSGRPIEAATPEIIDKIHDIVLTDESARAC